MMIGIVLASMTLARVAGGLLWATLSDHFNNKNSIMILGGVLAVLFFSLLQFSERFSVVYVALIGYTFFWSAILPLLESSTNQLLRGQSNIYSRIRVWGSISFLLLVIISGSLFASLSVETTIETGNLILLILLVVTLLRLPNLKVKPVASKQTDGPFWHKVTSRNGALFLASSFLLQLGFGAYYGFFSIYLNELGYSGFTIGCLIAFGVLCEVGIFYVSGKIIKRFSLKALFLACFVATALRWTMTGYYADILWLLAITQSIHALSFGLHHVAVQRFINDYFDKSQQARGQASYLAVSFGLGGALGSFCTGVLWQYGAQWAFGLSALVTLLAGICMLFFNFQTKVSQ